MLHKERHTIRWSIGMTTETRDEAKDAFRYLYESVLKWVHIKDEDLVCVFVL